MDPQLGELLRREIVSQAPGFLNKTRLDAVNPELPHYRQIRNFTIIPDVFTLENGLLTANGKLRRDAINARYASEMKAMYDATGNREAAMPSGNHKAVGGQRA